MFGVIVDARRRWNLTPRQVSQLERLVDFERVATKELQALRAGRLEQQLLAAMVAVLRGWIINRPR